MIAMRASGSAPQHTITGVLLRDAPAAHPLLGSRWHDTELSLPPGTAEVLAIHGHRAHLRFGPGRRAGEELDVELAELGRRFIRFHSNRGLR